MRSDPFARLAAIERATGKRIGAARPDDEPVRFVPSTSLAFAATDMRPSDEHAGEWETSFLGLTGAEGALPPYLAEEVAREEPDRAVRRALLTPFHHRATALLFRSVRRCRLPDETRDLGDAWPSRLLALVGAGSAQGPFERSLALALAPLLHARPSAASLARALRVVSARWLGGAPITLHVHTGGRVPIAADARARLGATRLGDTAILGGTVRDPDGRATIRVGPLAPTHARALDPGSEGRRALASVCRWLGDPMVALDVELLSEDALAHLGRARLGAVALAGPSRGPRRRPVDLDATTTTMHRQALPKAGPRPPKEPPCDPIRVRSSAA